MLFVCLFVCWGIFVPQSFSEHSSFQSVFLPVIHLHPVIKSLDPCLAGAVAASSCRRLGQGHGGLPGDRLLAALRHCQGRCTLMPASSFWSPWWDGVAVEDPHFGICNRVSHPGLYFTAHDFLDSRLRLCFSNPWANKMAGAGAWLGVA